MRRKTLVVLLVLVIAGLFVVYLWPVPEKSLRELAREYPVPEERLRSLERFRQEHPPKHLNVDGVTWEYIAVGQGEEALLFLHGMAGAYDIWWQQIEAFSPRYRVVSVTYPAVPSLEGLARGLEAILDREGVGRVTAVGSSLGGYLTQYLMATRPQRLRRAVLGNTFPPNDLYPKRYKPVLTIGPWLPEWAVLSVFRSGFYTRIHPTSRSNLLLVYLLEQSYGRMRKADVLARGRCVMETFEPPDPAALGIPVLIIESNNDPLVPPELRAQLKAQYPTARVFTFEDAGHFPYVNRAPEYNRVLEEFLNETP